ncbi:hypothetical protein pipiens_000813, partial [Culex pipiens pipiens]
MGLVSNFDPIVYTGYFAVSLMPAMTGAAVKRVKKGWNIVSSRYHFRAERKSIMHSMFIKARSETDMRDIAARICRDYLTVRGRPFRPRTCS